MDRTQTLNLVTSVALIAFGPGSTLSFKLEIAAEGSIRQCALILLTGVRDMGALISWLAHGSLPVTHREAERRALICAVCPLNQRGGLLAYFTRKAAKLIQKEIERKTSMDLWTTVDPILGVCKACRCVMELKVHVDEDTIVKHLKPKTRSKLHEDCWILKLPT